MVESLALSRPEVGFFLRSEGRRCLAFPAAADLRERVAQVHGLSLARSLIALEDPLVWGLVSPLAVSFPTRRYLHVAVNGRVVEADSFAPVDAQPTRWWSGRSDPRWPSSGRWAAALRPRRRGMNRP